jgi:serine/threonine-protein kinase
MRIATPTPPPLGAIPIGEGRRVVIGSVLGQGATTTVYEGVLEGLHAMRRRVAIKLWRALGSEERDSVMEGLGYVAQRSACVHHPNVVDTYEIGVHNGLPFIVSELVEGRPLPDLVSVMAQRGRRVPLDIALFVATEVAEGLNGARIAKNHLGVQLGIAHLNLSAREVMLSYNGEVKLTDFEIGAVRLASSAVRSLSKVARCAEAMSPEIACGVEGDARSDVFSLGVLMHELLIGPRFPRGISDADAILRAREGWVQPITFEPHLPSELQAIVFRALEIDPAARYQNAGAMVYHLRHVALSLGVGDGRFFLRQTLQAELDDERSDTAIELPERTSA